LEKVIEWTDHCSVGDDSGVGRWTDAGALGGRNGRLTGAGMTWAYLFQGLIVDKAGSIFGHLKLTLLDLLAKLPIGECE
jgi:hypothetical protein